MTLSRDEILKTPDLPREEVEVPEWGGTVYVRSLTAEEKDQFEMIFLGEEGKAKSRKDALRNIRARLVALTSCDEGGNRLFTEEDIPALGKKNARAIDRIFTVAQKLCGMRNEDVKELAKNSDPE